MASNHVLYKYYCRVCKKGFMCGRALGGHMRAHGIGDHESADMEGDDVTEVTDNKRATTYTLRANSNHGSKKSVIRICEHCGREFFCWKSFLEHGECTQKEHYGSLPKRKKSMRKGVDGNEEEKYDDIVFAKWLLDLANNRAGESPSSSSCASTSKEEEEFMVATARRRGDGLVPNKNKVISKKTTLTTFECKTCNKVFTSHQALGGHRASHKKVKGCYATKKEEIVMDNNNDNKNNNSVNIGGHECSICHKVFSTGQALGGHKRCHWNTPNHHHHRDHRTMFMNRPVDHRLLCDNDTIDLNLAPAAAQVDDNSYDYEHAHDVSTEIHLNQWSCVNNVDKERKKKDLVSSINGETEMELKKFAKMSGQKDEMGNIKDDDDLLHNWLQVGIGSDNKKIDS